MGLSTFCDDDDDDNVFLLYIISQNRRIKLKVTPHKLTQKLTPRNGGEVLVVWGQGFPRTPKSKLCKNN